MGAAVGKRGSELLPWSVAFVMHHLATQFSDENRTTETTETPIDMRAAFKADTKAEGQDVIVGGWECVVVTPTHRARWFSALLTRQSASWAWSRGGALSDHLGARLVRQLVVRSRLWGRLDTGPQSVDEDHRVCHDDNQGNPYALSKLMASKFQLPLMILVQLAAQLKEKGLDLGLEWIPRDQKEADALTNSRFEDFDVSNRIVVDINAIEWRILPRMPVVSEDIHRIVTEKREERRKKKEKEEAPQHENYTEKRAPRLKRGERQRARHPW